MSNENLDVIVSSIYTEFPNCGIRRMKGFLLIRGIHVQWERVRASLWRVDPRSMLLRSMQLHLVRRRHYSVPGPLSLWHLDGNHKIIRWGFVIHGCVDGYSRRVMFLRASTNNKANTVFTLFMEAVENFWLPRRVRGDQGIENVEVAGLCSHTHQENLEEEATLLEKAARTRGLSVLGGIFPVYARLFSVMYFGILKKTLTWTFLTISTYFSSITFSYQE